MSKEQVYGIACLFIAGVLLIYLIYDIYSTFILKKKSARQWLYDICIEQLESFTGREK